MRQAIEDGWSCNVLVIDRKRADQRPNFDFQAGCLKVAGPAALIPVSVDCAGNCITGVAGSLPLA
jgi:hypothetical protein